MSIIIKDMNMPNSCMECPFSDHEAWCLIPGDWRERYYCPDDERSDDCPLVEIPKGAKLIDARDVKKHMIPLDFSVQNWISEVDLDVRVPVFFEEGKK